MTPEKSTHNQLKESKTLGVNDRIRGNNQEFHDLSDEIKNTLATLQGYIDSMDMQSFYQKIEDLKYLIEYSDELNKNWYMIRAYSGALARLLEKKTAEHAIEVYSYYEQTYGGRRILKDENWFEQNRWEFLDELKSINSMEKLDSFVEKRTKKLNGFFLAYKSELLIFIQAHND